MRMFDRNKIEAIDAAGSNVGMFDGFADKAKIEAIEAAGGEVVIYDTDGGGSPIHTNIGCAYPPKRARAVAADHATTLAAIHAVAENAYTRQQFAGTTHVRTHIPVARFHLERQAAFRRLSWRFWRLRKTQAR